MINFILTEPDDLDNGYIVPNVQIDMLEMSLDIDCVCGKKLNVSPNEPGLCFSCGRKYSIGKVQIKTEWPDPYEVDIDDPSRTPLGQ